MKYLAALLFTATTAHAGIVGGPNNFGMAGPMVDGSSLPAPVVGFPGLQIKLTSSPTNTSDRGEFRTKCDISHMEFDDPLVYPGQPGKSHLHAFAGRVGVNAFTNLAALRDGGASTCDGGDANKTAYWFPPFVDIRNGRVAPALYALVYYKQGFDLPNWTTFFAPPTGLAMVTGSMSNEEPKGPFRYSCGESTPWVMDVPDCAVGKHLVVELNFPQCWDGERLDSPDHKSHMAAVVNKACPATHPKPIPKITLNIHYAINEPGVTKFWRLSSDMYDTSKPGGYSMHGDWVNGWDPEVMQSWVGNCLNGHRDCHVNLLGDGRALY